MAAFLISKRGIYMRQNLKSIAIISLVCFGIVPGIQGETEKKKVTIINAQTSADGKSRVSKELLEECIESLPDASSLVADVKANTQFLKGINGDNNKKDHVRTYEATIEINYMLYQKELIVVTTNSVESTPPVMEEKERRIQQSQIFKSKSENGDLFAGRSNRKYYFSNEEAAIADVKKTATNWLQQKSAVLCK